MVVDVTIIIIKIKHTTAEKPTTTINMKKKGEKYEYKNKKNDERNGGQTGTREKK